MSDLCKETKWLCENAKNLEKFSGQWVMFSAHEGVVGCNESLDHILKVTRHRKSKPAPFVFHVPSKEELVSPVPIVKKQ